MKKQQEDGEGRSSRKGRKPRTEKKITSVIAAYDGYSNNKDIKYYQRHDQNM